MRSRRLRVGILEFSWNSIRPIRRVRLDLEARVTRCTLDDDCAGGDNTNHCIR